VEKWKLHWRISLHNQKSEIESHNAQACSVSWSTWRSVWVDQVSGQAATSSWLEILPLNSA
jgi:hypothetical protein